MKLMKQTKGVFFQQNRCFIEISELIENYVTEKQEFKLFM